MIRVRQTFDHTSLDNVSEEINTQLSNLKLETAVKPGQTAAVACSSRGIYNYGAIIKAVISYLKQLKLEPFIIPAMGSHGAATAAGQKRVLAHLGIVAEDMGAPIRSSLEVVRLGETEDRLPVYLDKLASQADHIVLINRIKKHTEFEHEFESGLLKMMAIGLGKQEGAAAYHEAMLTFGYPRIILTVAHKMMQSANILFGLGVVENGYGQTAQIGICRSDGILDMEKRLFKSAKAFAPKLPFDEADVIIITQLLFQFFKTGADIFNNITRHFAGILNLGYQTGQQPG